MTVNRKVKVAGIAGAIRLLTGAYVVELRSDAKDRKTDIRVAATD